MGIIANATAALGISLASETRNLIGKNVADKDGRMHEGSINSPIPVLGLSKEEIFSFQMKIKK
ncbi:Protein of unknown function [Natronincola peptidivorans]|uniref:Uncharacterized protein n=1 Tax=Natronincola peptidivorans TaxID=426128 RepID=A0A1I0AZF8_9FIRM|nr:DUF2000 family protein [Natronincola peptidivorans]SES99414.1 Protein of unknown function [Natronincola peptidivorans]